MSDGSHWPRTWAEAVPLVAFGTLVFAAGFEGVNSLVHGEWITSIISFVLMVGLLAMLIHWPQIKEWRPGPPWVAAAAMVAIVAIALSPFVQQRRWPFTTYITVPGESTSSVLRWSALTSSETSALAARLRFVPPADIVVACETLNCRDLADGLAAILQKTPGWKVSILHRGGLDITGVTGIRLNPNEPAAQALKEAIEATTSLKVEIGPDVRKDMGTDQTFLVVGNRPF